MNDLWRDFLTDAGAEWNADGDKVVHFGNPERESRAALAGLVFADLSHYQPLWIGGDEAQSFLQGQLTNDTRRVTPEQAQLTAFCTPQGKVRAVGLLNFWQNAYLWWLPQENWPETHKKLAMYVLRAKVTLGQPPMPLFRLGLSGAKSEQLLREQWPALPPLAPYQQWQNDAFGVLRLPGTLSRFLLFSNDMEKMQMLWQQLNVQAAPVGAVSWKLLQVEAGIPEIYPDNRERFTPQMLSLDLLGAVSFDKGCYTGQEIVARAHYLGKVKRRLFRLHLPFGVTLQALAEITGEAGGHGEILTWARHFEGYRVLAVLPEGEIQQTWRYQNEIAEVLRAVA